MPFEGQVFINLEEVMRWIGVGRRHDGREDVRGQLNAHAAQARKGERCRYGQVDAFHLALAFGQSILEERLGSLLYRARS